MTGTLLRAGAVMAGLGLTGRRPEQRQNAGSGALLGGATGALVGGARGYDADGTPACPRSRGS